MTPPRASTSYGQPSCVIDFSKLIPPSVKGRGVDIIHYLIDNEIHNRGQGYVYLRALNIETASLLRPQLTPSQQEDKFESPSSCGRFESKLSAWDSAYGQVDPFGTRSVSTGTQLFRNVAGATDKVDKF